MTQYAVAHALQIIGEAAAHVSEERRVQITDRPWANIVGMRNRLVHDYGRIDRSVLWDTLQEDTPGSVAALERLVPREPSAEAS
jgi:uncharacterized protein with HEPN domain